MKYSSIAVTPPSCLPPRKGELAMRPNRTYIGLKGVFLCLAMTVQACLGGGERPQLRKFELIKEAYDVSFKLVFKGRRRPAVLTPFMVLWYRPHGSEPASAMSGEGYYTMYRCGPVKGKTEEIAGRFDPDRVQKPCPSVVWREVALSAIGKAPPQKWHCILIVNGEVAGKKLFDP